MKKYFLILVFINLFAFNPNPINTEIIATNNKFAVIDKDIQKGKTGYVIHNNSVIAKAISLGDRKVKYLPFYALKNSALATPKIMPKKYDNIIFGLYNKRALLIAPNQNEYIKTLQKHPNIEFISSDIFANYVNTAPTIKNFQNFCNDFKIGIIDFLLDKEYIVDCQSMYVLNTYKIKPKKYKKAFFTNYDKLKNGFFDSKPNNWIKYYKSILKGDNG